MMTATGKVIGRNMSEVTNVFGQDREAAGNGLPEHVVVIMSGKPDFRDCSGLDVGRGQARGQRGWIHLIEQQLHC